jgi:hypothetical protein
MAVSDSTVTQWAALPDATGHEDELFAAVGLLDAHRARLDAGDQRRVARVDAQLARLAGQGDNVASPEKMDSSALTTST